MNARELTVELKAEAHRLGFELAGVCAAQQAPGYERFEQWLSAGYAGQMAYLPDRKDAYAHPDSVLGGVRSLLMLGINYRSDEPRDAGEGQGRVSRYAWGEADYHDLIHDKLKRLKSFLVARQPSALVRGVVDTAAPLAERDFAQLAGLGWIGKNTLLLNKQMGSWFFLAALLTDLELHVDASHQTDHCGTCRACLDACPTNAFPEPYVLDAARCISYLTIELRDHIPASLRASMGDWLFGCDDCQTVCPWNRHAPLSGEAVLTALPSENPIDLIELFELDDDSFRRRFRRTPLWRSKRRGILRNAAIALGNRPTAKAADALIRGLNDEEPLVRAACAWALRQLGGPKAIAALQARRQIEENADVMNEIA